MTERGLALALVGLLAPAGCNNSVTVRPVIETPVGDQGTSVFGEISTIEISIAIEGEESSIVSKLFRRGETLELTDVPYGENLVIHMLGRASNSEVAYGRTCPFAVRADEDPPEPRLYFARTVRWARSAMPPNPVRIGGGALTSRNGSALYFGGIDHNGATVLGADRFDPVTGRFEELARLPPRRDGSAASLGDGRAILVGGVDGEDQVTENIDVISIDAGQEEAVEPVPAKQLSSRAAPSLATLSDGSVVAFGGLNSNGTPFTMNHEIVSDGTVLVIRELDEGAKLRFPRYGHTMTRLSSDFGAPVLIAGGRDALGMPVPITELYRPLVERIAPAAEFAEPMQTPRWDHAAVRLPDGSVVIIGGRNLAGPVTSVEVFTFETGFDAKEVLPAGTGVTELSVTPLPDGRILLAGGKDVNGVATDAASIVRIDAFGGSIDIINTDRLSVPRAGHTATLLCDGTVLLVGGTNEETPAERYNPPSAGRR